VRGLRLQNCTFNGARLYIGGDATARDVTIEDNTWTSTVTYGITILKDGAGAVTIHGNTVPDGAATSSGIVVREPGQHGITDNVVSGFPDGTAS